MSVYRTGYLRNGKWIAAGPPYATAEEAEAHVAEVQQQHAGCDVAIFAHDRNVEIHNDADGGSETKH